MKSQSEKILAGLSDMLLMQLTGVSITTKRNMELRGVFVRLPDGSWDAEKCIPSYIEWLKKRHRSGQEEGGEGMSDPEAEFRRQKARMEKLKADQMEEKLIEVSEVGRQWERHVHAAKNKFLGLTDKMMAEISPLLRPTVGMGEVREPLMRLTFEALAELAKEPEEDTEEEEEEGGFEDIRLDSGNATQGD